MRQIEVIAKAREMGFDAVEFANLVPPNGEAPADWQRKQSGWAFQSFATPSALIF